MSLMPGQALTRLMGERGLLKEGREDDIDKVRDWLRKDGENLALRAQGEQPLPLHDLHIVASESLKPEALALAPRLGSA